MASIKLEAVENLIKKESIGESLIVLEPQIKLIPKAKIKAEKIIIKKLPNKTFKAKSLLPDKFKCPKCNKAFKCKSPLKAHLILCGKKTFDCKNCDKKFIKKHSLNAHFCAKCKHCSRSFNSRKELHEHINSAHTEKSKQTLYECDICGKKFLYRAAIFHHIKVMHIKSKDTFYCDNCPLKFNSIQAIRSHMRKHVSLIECEICGKKMNMFWSIYTHMKRVHGENPRKFRCPKCPSRFKDKHKLARHLFIHNKLVCSINNCGIKFSDRNEYNYHVKSHENPDLLTCKVCGKIMKTKFTFEFHMNQIHGNGKELKLKCNKCDYKTYSKGHFNLHLKVHEGYDKKLKQHPNLYRCDKCPLTLFQSKPALVTHMKMIHMASEFFKCEACKRVYKLEKNLKRHKCKCK